MSVTEIVAAVLGLASVWLTVKQKVLAWPIGAVMVALYTYVFWDAKLYADMGLQVVYFVLQFYGWYEWLRGGAGKEALAVTHTSGPLWVVLVLFAVIFGAGLGHFLATSTDAALPYWDSAITSMSLAAQYMLAKKKRENWLVWMVVNVLSVGVFGVKGLYATSALYFVFLLMAVAGWREWRKAPA